MNRNCLTCLVAIILAFHTAAQPRTDDKLVTILSSNPHPLFQQVLQQRQQYRLQIIYTEINRNRKNKPSFKNYCYNVDPGSYYYPASTVKLPLALLTLEKLNKLKVPGVNRKTTIVFDSSYSRQTSLQKDESSESGLPSISHFIKQVFLISENDAANRMYEFLGQKETNRSLHRMGYPDVRITHRFSRPMSMDENRHTNTVRFLDAAGKTIYTQPAAFNTDSFDIRQVVKVGNAFLNGKGEKVNEPFDFSHRNNISLASLHQMLRSVMFPETVNPKQRFLLTEDDYRFIRQYMSQLPGETNYPKYDTGEYYESYVKFFFADSNHHQMPKGVRVFNKPGWAYGFMTDVAYIADFENNIEFMLSATIYVNDDGVLNDNKYDDETIGAPFLYQLGQTIYQHELNRKRKYKPILDTFKMSYEVRDINDKRKEIRAVDN